MPAIRAHLLLKGTRWRRIPPSYTYMGTPETYRRVGFVDVTPAGQKRLVMRYTMLTEFRRRN